MNYKNGAFAETQFTVSEKGSDVTFTIDPAKGDTSVIPEKRVYTLSFCDVADCEKLTVSVNGKRSVTAEKTAVKEDGKINLTVQAAVVQHTQMLTQWLGNGKM